MGNRAFKSGEELHAEFLVPVAASVRQEVRAEFLSRVPVSARSVIRKSFQGSVSPRQAIKAMCLTCAGYGRDEIRFCRVVLCPLLAYRPYQAGR
jgi:hypothetical protein